MKTTSPIIGQERRFMDYLKLEQVIIDYLHTIPAHKDSEIQLRSIEPTLKGLHVSWKQTGVMQRYGRTLKWELLAELTKEIEVIY